MLEPETIKFTWSVDDGYVSSDRPQTLRIDVDDLAEYCSDPCEVRDQLSEIVSEEFRKQVAPFWDESEVSRVLAAWDKARKRKVGGR